MKISIIAAMDSKNGIGKGNDLLFKIPEDFARMQKLTMGHPLVMGRKTFESIGRVLPNRYNIVITRDLGFKINDSRFGKGFIILDSLEHAIEEALRSSQGKQNDEIFIFGGGQIFKEALEKGLVDKLYLTIVDGDYNADTFFPDYSNFKIVSEEKGESGDYKYKFLDFIR